jgi:hypothetical protein
MLIDSSAFRQVLGKGCPAPDQKCERDRYKKQLIKAIEEAGKSPIVGGMEYASALVEAMDLDAMAAADPSFGRFVEDTRRSFRTLTAP